MKIIPLSEGSFTVDNTKQFVPFDQQTENLQSRPGGSLLVEIQPFVVITTNDILLLDTGLGFSDKDGKMQLHKNLAKVGIEPSAVTKVLMSHLHKDHAGGISLDNDRKQLSLPGATYYIQQREFDLAVKKGFPSFIPGELHALSDSNKVVWLQDDEGSIDGYIHYKVTGAHSPLHQVFWLKDPEGIVFFGGDDAPQLHQMKHRFVAKYDYDGKKAMELRKEWWLEGEKEKWTFLFYHDIKTPVYKKAED